MSSTTWSATKDARHSLTAVQRFARRTVVGRMAGIRGGAIELSDALGTETAGDPHGDLRVSVTVRDPRFWSAMLFGGSLAAGEAFVDGWWTCSDVAMLARLLVRNLDHLNGLERGFARARQLANAVWARSRRNDHAGSRRNISEHYDLGNEFFALFLDPTMMYSCAIFERPDASLEEASIAKLDTVCRKLQLKAGERVVEIGSGWGGFALHAARNYGVHVTTTTISRRQYELAVERVREAGLEDRVRVLFEDYRNLTGRYDKLVSIEMIEAVGHEFLPGYFAKIGELLEDDGLALIQAITVRDQEYERARREVDFIKKHIFPGSFIPSVTAILSASTRASDLRLVEMEDIGAHYAPTLRHWRERLLSRRGELERLGLDERFQRAWEWYLATCEGGFTERYNGDVQLLFARPGNRRRTWGIGA
ncbi:MAG TPA: cyclopropane-fatty-acyl-phospholipid synthase family protein [Gemmatimonadaceae bacterium]|nr:cyclopropane-fatty-acyl-phospholipid synthase family protein [Gemmatimonadaceae bacterium]